MNVERFAGDNPMMKQFALAMQQNAQVGKALNKQALTLTEQQTKRDVAAAYGRII